MQTMSSHEITEENASVISTLSGYPFITIHANIGWVACYNPNNKRFWRLMPSLKAKMDGYIPSEELQYAEKTGGIVEPLPKE